ncbi:type VI secretion system Vgr family protein [Polyangium aurulentum]|uniref:type VI secretion system Vgr family protein n=1 Tax=Polyangium aurulentum TaxID=2567896 RepID=UPI0010AE52AF|nr:type VI secretion system tip protein TssI/VgrG [Polyangium aurulentum]UQA56369.1 type VI secretion system tip protein VgrG [Polyangium aurulentum]
MPSLELSFASNEDSLSVRRFAIREEISSLFEVDVLARSPLDEIDLEGLVDGGAGFGFDSGVLHLTTTKRVWTGICSHMELVQAEPTGLSTYFIKIVPALWRTTQRRNNRIFQHMTIPAIVGKVLAEWQIEPELRLGAQYPEHEFRVQYGETDFAFISRLLEEAGIAYFFTHEPPQTVLVLSDEPTAPGPRPPLPYVDNPNEAAEREFVTKVKLSQRVKPGRFTLRDFDFRQRLDYQLFTEARARTELAYEQYVYEPGAFWVEPGQGGGTPMADDKGVARTNEKEGKARATRELDGARRGRRAITFETNVVDLSPGTAMTVEPHPRGDIAGKKLLVIQSSLEGEPGDAWTMKGEAVYTDVTYRPERRTPRPRIQGVQSAVVVGPPGEEIHVDEFGRVRVQFHWDREGSYDDGSSCWIRVSQGWAGAGYGFLNLPRVGQEVLVEFFEGDPDRPVITGRVFSYTRRTLYNLPENKTKSGWKSESSPGAGGFNELSFEDAAGREEIHIQAQKDFTELVKNNQSSTVLNNRSASVTSNDSMSVGQNQSFSVGASQSHTIGKVQSNNIGESRSSTIGQSDSINAGDLIKGNVGTLGVGYSFSKDQNITITNSIASIVFKPDGLYLNTKGDFVITADGTLKLSGGTVLVDGIPNVYVNCAEASAADVPTVDPARAPTPPGGPGSGGATIEPQSVLSGQGTVEEPGGFEEVSMDLASMPPPISPSAAPDSIHIPTGAASAIGAAVSGASTVTDAAEALRSTLHLDTLSGALELYGMARSIAEGDARALLQAPAGRQLLGSVLTSPITGSVTGRDIAALLDQGQQVGIFHLGSVGGELAAAAASGADSALPAGVQQFMALRTQAAPPALDGGEISNAISQNRVLGYAPVDAQAAALEQHGVALFQGNGAGLFRKIVPGLPGR